ncbi:MAG: 23S rRNA (guanosine(2251)-2'-O)-methyltransferase RlmB [Acidobacteriota bacterium]
MVIYGINPVLEALQAGRVVSVHLAQGRRERLEAIRRLAQSEGLDVREATAAELARLARTSDHQGAVAIVRQAQAFSVTDLVALSDGPALLVVLDGVEDPHNVGAIIRTLDAAGAGGLVRQTRHAAPLGGAAAKASAGAVAHVRVADVVNIARSLEDLTAAGVWTIGLAAEAPETYDQVDLTLPSAIVLGAEGQGLRRLVRERCDRLVSIPMLGKVSSLNVAAAASVVLFEAVRQRRLRP